MNGVFLDTVGLIAVWDTSDQWHAERGRWSGATVILPAGFETGGKKMLVIMLWKSGGVGNPQRPLTPCGSTPAADRPPQ